MDAEASRAHVACGTPRTLAELEPGSSAFLYVHHHIREDAQTLFGFLSRDERTTFQVLINTHGIGPALALAILGTHSPSALVDIVATAGAAGSFTKLAQALDAAGLTSVLQGPGPFTVFAPVNAAFAKLPAGTVDTLLKPENKDKLTAILMLHVLPGKVMAADVVGKAMDVATAGGAHVHVDGTDGVTVDGAHVVTADIACTNGVIHVIDAVILPKA